MKAKTKIEILTNWQQDMMNSKQLVHVSNFQLQPQTKGFHLQLELYIADKHDSEMNPPYRDFFGTIDECINQGLNWIKEEKERLKGLL